jgi:uncharacterized SAM-binding protein YcdF (DUF218 family)
MMNWGQYSQPIVRWSRILLLTWGAMTLAVCLWLIAGLSLPFEGALKVSSVPVRADAIVCIGGGTTKHDLPTDDGWQRIYTSAELFADGYAPTVVFTGRGNSKVSEAEIYADAAQWLGVPAAAIRLDPLPSGTAQHPEALLASMGGAINRNSRLLLVTSALHSRRVQMTFQRHSFTNVTVVSDYSARTRLPGAGPRGRSQLPAFVRDSKEYTDPLFRLARGSSRLFTVLREWAAIAVYRARGWV